MPKRSRDFGGALGFGLTRAERLKGRDRLHAAAADARARAVLDVIAREAPVASHVEVPERELIGETELDRRGPAADAAPRCARTRSSRPP